MPTAPLARAHLAQYTVKSSDVLADMRVNVLEEGTENILWYKERIMTDDEVVESVVESATDTLKWTVHRPKRGWYLRLRCPSFPPGTFIPLVPPTHPQPPSQTAPGQTLSSPVAAKTVLRPITDGSLTFSVRAPTQMPEKPSSGEVRINIGSHSYPPTPPAASSPVNSQSLAVPSPRDLNSKLRALSSHNNNLIRFVLSPSLPEPVSPHSTTSAFLSRALTYLTPTLPIRATVSFTISPFTPPGEVCIPLLTFTDRTSTFSVLTTGLLEVNKGLERQIGVDPAFWIAVSLAYLEFLADRDSYLAAMNG